MVLHSIELHTVKVGVGYLKSLWTYTVVKDKSLNL